ncbi:6,7,8-trihydroxycoumarin synthase-like [Arachis duranensis]|uniref:6,7,8-trihydroxycoumarin synthase-like n=1 Tax=Arachis duranensis TaxID=130453 RepID=A0A6P4D8M1_ARADU|nr:6,7,8-trihydroxycoumarin synthase-like [Arachis duranensis]
MFSFLYYLLLLAVPLMAVVIFHHFKKQQHRRTTLPPGPKPLPIIGNLHQLDSSNLNVQLWNLSKIYGSIFSLQIGFKPAIVISSPKLAKEVLKDHDLDVSSRPPSLGTTRLSYNGFDLIFSPYSEYWREIRKICVVHFFSSKRISGFYHIRKSEVERMLGRISEHVSSSKTTNLSEILMSVSSSIVCRIAFGRRYDDEGAERSRFHGLLNEIQAIFLAFFVSDYIPFMGWVDRVSGLLDRVEKTFKELDEFLQGVIEEHEEDHNNGKKGEDIVDVLLELKKQGNLSIDITNDHIKAITMNMLVAASDTTAATTTWIMTALMKNPRVMKKAQEEIRSLYGKKPFIEDEDIEKLVYLKAVIKETLRYYAPAPLVPREFNKKSRIAGYEIEAKTIVYVNVFAIHRDPETWKDPEVFDPERFIDSNINFNGQDFELIPFGAGRRICPGIPLGSASVELITANLLNSFDWEMPQGMKREDIDSEGLPGLARHKKNHLCLLAKNHI